MDVTASPPGQWLTALPKDMFPSPLPQKIKNKNPTEQHLKEKGGLFSAEPVTNTVCHESQSLVFPGAALWP